VDQSLDRVAAAWDREYRRGRYIGEPPVPFVRDIVSVAEREGLSNGAGLYIGCGIGRNYLPLVDAGLDLTGIDVSLTAIQELARRVPSRANRLIHGDLSALPAGTTYRTVVGIQVFQHGSRAFCHDHIRSAQRRVGPGGILALRVNAVGTDIEFAHEVVEPPDGSGFTIRYLEGPKAGLLVHFFDRDELEKLFLDAFETALPLRLDSTVREAPRVGQWSQWEVIWARRKRVGSRG
jgi:SAM-dependent methyltransferase